MTGAYDARAMAGTAAADFVERFATTWAKPDPDSLTALLAEDGVLVQPLAPTTRGRAEARAGFVRLFRTVPDLRATVHRWSDAGDALFIEFTLAGTFGGRELAWDVVDRIVLRDGLVQERIAYFDGAALAREIAKRPRGWPRFVAARLRPAR